MSQVRLSVGCEAQCAHAGPVATWPTINPTAWQTAASATMWCLEGSAGTQGVKFRGAGRGGGAAAGRLIQDYSIVPGRRNWQIETAAWIWPSFFHCALETRWLGVLKTCGIGLFYRNYRPLLQETGWLVSDFISVCLETRWLGQKRWFLCAGTTLYLQKVQPRNPRHEHSERC